MQIRFAQQILMDCVHGLASGTFTVDVGNLCVRVAQQYPQQFAARVTGPANNADFDFLSHLQRIKAS